MRTLSEIAGQQREWSERNFPANTPLEPLEGLWEEVGELAHARLKRRQAIRGTAEQHIEAERDAIGDIGIYLLDFAWRVGMEGIGNVVLEPSPYPAEVAFGEAAMFLRIGCTVADMSVAFIGRCSGTDTDDDELFDHVAGLVAVLSSYCRSRGWDFMEILDETWERVSKRNWRADPVGAGS